MIPGYSSKLALNFLNGDVLTVLLMQKALEKADHLRYVFAVATKGGVVAEIPAKGT